MKSTITTLLICVLCYDSISAQQKIDIPPNIKAAFAKNCAGATKVRWEKEHGRYEVSFVLNGKEMSVLYNTSGLVDEVETKIAVSELPAKARAYATSKGKIKEAAKLVSADGKVSYEADVNGRDLMFDENGNLLEEISGKSDKD